MMRMAAMPLCMAGRGPSDDDLAEIEEGGDDLEDDDEELDDEFGDEDEIDVGSDE